MLLPKRLLTIEEIEQVQKEFDHRLMRDSGLFLKCPYCEEEFPQPPNSYTVLQIGSSSDSGSFNPGIALPLRYNL